MNSYLTYLLVATLSLGSACNFGTGGAAGQPQNNGAANNGAGGAGPGFHFDGSSEGYVGANAELETHVADHISVAGNAHTEIMDLLSTMSGNGARPISAENLTDADVDAFYQALPALLQTRNRVGHSLVATTDFTAELIERTTNSDGTQTTTQPLEPLTIMVGIVAGGIALMAGLAKSVDKVDEPVRERIENATDAELPIINRALNLPETTSREDALAEYTSQLTPSQRMSTLRRIKQDINAAAIDTNNPDIRVFDDRRDIAEAAEELGKTAVTTVVSASTSGVAASQLPKLGETLGRVGQAIDAYQDVAPFIDLTINATSAATGESLQPTDLVANHLYSSTVVRDSSVEFTIPGHFEPGVYDNHPDDVNIEQILGIFEQAARDPDYYRIEYLDHVASRLAALLAEAAEGVDVSIAADGTATVTVPRTHLREAGIDELPLTVEELAGLLDTLIVLPGDGSTDFNGLDATSDTEIELLIGEPAANNETNNGSTNNGGTNNGGDGDADGDGVIDRDDNCVDTPNWYQIDSDGDGVGNECDDTACPDFEVDADGCVDGMDWDRQVAACSQPMCPTGAGHTYDKYCCCDCWDDKTLASVYDPCRPGYLLTCAEPDPNG